nr:integrase, catalytic region, zinc finger, CCHC-type, peptidase aspartic, catalytic [Tanacetum cinerariifolium]
MGTTKDILGTADDGGVTLRIDRLCTYNDLDKNEKKRFDADIRDTNIVLQGLPKDIYKLINHNTEAKAIWDNMIPGENITDYYVRFHKLVNDMRNIKITMPNIQLNSKFVNNMTLEWDSVAGNGSAQNRDGNANQGHKKPIKCYNCGGFGHISKNCTQPKRPYNSHYFKEKMLLMQAQENGVVLDEEELLFLSGEQANTYDVDVDDQPVQDMAQMSSLQQAGPSNASILSEVLNLENAIDHHEIPNEVQQTNVLDLDSADMGSSKVITTLSNLKE